MTMAAVSSTEIASLGVVPRVARARLLTHSAGRTASSLSIVELGEPVPMWDETTGIEKFGKASPSHHAV
jgi:hypothetical protein